MGRTLNMLEHLLADARRLVELGQHRDALSVLRRLSRITDIAVTPCAEVQLLLGTTYRRLGQFKAARRHLRRAIQWAPMNAAAHHELARAIQDDPRIDAARAARPFATAIELAPDDARLLADAGAFHVAMNRPVKGLKLLQRAVELAPDDLELLRRYVEALCDVARFDQARRVVRLARFRLSAEPALAQLRTDVEFRQSRDQQLQGKEDRSTVLPFLRLVSDEPCSVRERKYRRDVISHSHPHLPRVGRQIDRGRSG